MYERSTMNGGEISLPLGSSEPVHELARPLPRKPLRCWASLLGPRAGALPNASPSTFQSP